MLKRGIELGNKIAVATLGFKGAILYDGSKFYQQEPQLVNAVDTLGAGDSFITAFLLNYFERIHQGSVHSEEQIKYCLSQGAEFAAKSCMLEGAFGFGITY